MRKVLALPLIAAALAFPAGLAMASDVTGPACADITAADFGYSADGLTATVNLDLGSASCPGVSYTLVAQDDVNETTIVGVGSTRGDGNVPITVTAPISEQDGWVCLYAVTSAGGRVFDRAPDASNSPNCLRLFPGGSGGGVGFG